MPAARGFLPLENRPEFLAPRLIIWLYLLPRLLYNGNVKWNVEELNECESTFDVARRLPAWSVVSALRQTKGRGRFNRTWHAGPGGLWVSYNLPLPADSGRPWSFLPLVAGVAVMDALKPFNIPGLRLRWPNDVLVGRAKLAGILVERPKSDIATIGVGINVLNNIVDMGKDMPNPPVRLADIVPSCPDVTKLRTVLGDSLAVIFDCFLQGGPEALAPMLACAWDHPKPVVVITETERFCGYFSGVEHNGSPVLRRADGTRFSVPGTSVVQLKELI